jgi:hypothetical protein
VAPIVARLLAACPAATRPFSQRDGERPVGCGRAKYLRVWRRARAAGDAGATSEGRARILTPDAWARHRQLPSRKRPVGEVQKSVADAFGIEAA